MGGLRKVLLCHGCHDKFLREELVYYTTARAQKGYYYCQKCLKEKKDRELFLEKVCEIFGIKSPGQRIWKERERIINKYGFTDKVIVDCLDYLYNEVKVKKLVETIVLVNPVNVQKMRQFQHDQTAQANQIVNAFKTEVREYNIKPRENTEEKKEEWNPDDWLD